MSSITIEDVINERLASGMKENALDFSAHLRSLDLSLPEFKQEQRKYQFDIEYRGIMLCFILISHASIRIDSSQVPCSWIYWSDGEHEVKYEEPDVDDKIKKIAWKRVRTCKSCGACGQAPGKRKRVLGRDFDHVCISALGFSLPSTESWECLKQFVTAMKNDIDNYVKS
ncbi:MAG: hypothetical protein FWD06_08775 [Oscillospiraceae bacterium]|nr:hypothetical protein [Oscillospiraceae bacterium]